MKNDRMVMIIFACMKIINVFLGPFLVAYFIITSTKSIIDVSCFNILNYLCLCLFGMLAGYVTEKRGTLLTFRLGIFVRFLCVLAIMFLGDNLVSYYWIVSFTYGFSSMFFYLPFNLYHTDCVQNSERSNFEFKMNVIKNFVSVFIPIILGTVISVTNYQLTALIILVFSVIQIIASFYLKPLPKSDKVYDISGYLKKAFKNKQEREMFYVEFLNGLTLSDGVLGTVITILIMFSFKSEFNLGIINSVLALLSLIVLYIYSKHYKGKDDRNIILFSGIVIFLVVILLIINISKPTIILYNVIYGIFGTGILTFIYGLRLFNLAKKKVTNKEKTEYWGARELFLNLGRVSGYILLLLVGLNGINYLIYLLIFLNFLVLLFAIFLSDIDKNEY